MDKQGHTPGPWFTFSIPRSGELAVGSGDLGANGYPTGRTLYRLTPRDHYPESGADARLIAASPELLAFVERWADQTDFQFAPSLWQLMGKEARALLSRVRGEA